MRNRSLRERPENFIVNYNHSLSRGLIFGGFCNYPRSIKYVDSSIYNNYASLSDMNPESDWTYVTSLNRMGIDFNGGTQNITINNNFWGILPISTMCVWAIAYTPISGSGRGIISINNGARFICIGQGTLNWMVHTWGDSSKDTGIPIIIGKPFHFCTISIYGACSYYVNGIRIGTSVALYNSINQLVIGDGPYSAFSINFVGNISDPMLYNRVLSLSELQQLVDPSNAMLSGMLQPPKRRYYPISRQIGTPYKKQYFVFNAGNNFVKVGN